MRRLGRRTYSQSQGSAFAAGAPAAPAPVPSQGPLSLKDAYLEYRRRLDANQSPALAMDANALPATLVPSDEPDFSGGLLGRLAAMAGFDPRSPTVVDANRIRVLSSRIAPRNGGSVGSAEIPSQLEAPPSQTNRLAGLVSGQPMPDFPLPPSVWGFSDSSTSSADDGQDWFNRWLRTVRS
ncbi:hypothetical protein [Bradyrhizobium sp. NP1]|uniref:hypothetical protein n=1 Tax=Bradyrhizobium sp. NP1 TaxID=3049772 RepID=UPI0025A6802D|nr:hypothetical protein [Bradyrhizobium sp. NP1]WJR76489.1 hypothetical protein QOU61_27550 [Bradyrhizobium sp. NP1]